MRSGAGSEGDPREQPTSGRKTARRRASRVPTDAYEAACASRAEGVAGAPGNDVGEPRRPRDDAIKPPDWRGKCGLPRTIVNGNLYFGCGRYILTFKNPENPNLPNLS